MAIEIAEIPPDGHLPRVVQRSDGFYWQGREGDKTVGPFATRAEAMDDMEYGDGNFEAGEPLEEAESEIGIADWIDPETGQPAEDSVPHIEEH